MSTAAGIEKERTGTFATATCHIITAVIGTGVLSLAWATAQLGWIMGPAALLIFAVITAYTSCLLADSYRVLDPVSGTRNYVYIDCVRATLGVIHVKLCAVVQYSNLIGTAIGYTITASASMKAMRAYDCFNRHGHQGACQNGYKQFGIIFGAIQIVLCQIPDFHRLSFISIIAAVMSIGYSCISFGLSMAIIAGGDAHLTRSLTGTQDVWHSFAALGNMAFAYSFSLVLIEIQDTLRSSPPENVVMKRASYTAIGVSTLFYLLCGLSGYAAFGNDVPGDILTGYDFYKPVWLVQLANICVIIHLIGAYQVFCQPFFAFVERWSSQKWPQSRLVNAQKVINLPNGSQFTISPFRLIWRSVYVIFTTTIATLLPFFNAVVGILGALGFWPITVYFPVEMHIALERIPRYSSRWILLKLLSLVCLLISIVAVIGSLQSIIVSF